MSRFFSIFGRAPAFSRTRKFPQKMTPNGHFSAKFRILNVSDFLAGVTRGNFFAERTLNLLTVTGKTAFASSKTAHEQVSARCRCATSFILASPYSRMHDERSRISRSTSIRATVRITVSACREAPLYSAPHSPITMPRMLLPRCPGMRHL
jgi:hypothetical protein